MYFLYVVPSQSPFFLGFSPSAFPMCVYFLGLLNGINQANEQWGSSYWTATFLVEKCNSMTELSDNRCHSFLLFILFRLPCFVKSLLLFRRLVFSSSFLLIKVVTKGRCAIPNWKPKTQKKKTKFPIVDERRQLRVIRALPFVRGNLCQVNKRIGRRGFHLLIRKWRIIFEFWLSFYFYFILFALFDLPGDAR